ncbi:MAG: hypothetical protein UV73_C0001G0068 [Candidatus Gottesmanbacteria bacterium GW2011_GWA2_43_14]|uniref:Uncharacterized protein n=1 Tax=Candidatus Gottesmanbacteria bacterium GW2011_GWA2_43_14 TaxID=1618443 RepID=A0A0G1DLT8_9BACT|nr:MAG: hypothetical protein UV73_C0001G0068 [Candidatus Gottesmanbacteria bacterium GW2011_GWA2_43_14]
MGWTDLVKNLNMYLMKNNLSVLYMNLTQYTKVYIYYYRIKQMVHTHKIYPMLNQLLKLENFQE